MYTYPVAMSSKPELIFRYVPSYGRRGHAPAGECTAEEASFQYFDALYRSSIPFVGLPLGALPFWDQSHRFSVYKHEFVTGDLKINLVCTDEDGGQDRGWGACWVEGAVNAAILAGWPPVRTKDQRAVLMLRYQRFLVPHAGLLGPLRDNLGMVLKTSSVCPPEPVELERWLGVIC